MFIWCPFKSRSSSDSTTCYEHADGKQCIPSYHARNAIDKKLTLFVAGIDTRALTKKLRSEGCMLCKIKIGQKKTEDISKMSFTDPNLLHLVDEVSVKVKHLCSSDASIHFLVLKAIYSICHEYAAYSRLRFKFILIFSLNSRLQVQLQKGCNKKMVISWNQVLR